MSTLTEEKHTQETGIPPENNVGGDDHKEIARTNLNSELKERFPVESIYCVGDAILAWRNHLHQESFWRRTKAEYLHRAYQVLAVGAINPLDPIASVNEEWVRTACEKIDKQKKWKEPTKYKRRQMIKTLFNFICNQFDPDYTDTSQWPKHWNSAYVFSEVLCYPEEKWKLLDVDTVAIFDLLKKRNERDCLIFCTMSSTGRRLDEILDLRPNQIYDASIHFDDGESMPVARCFCSLIKSQIKGEQYAFTTRRGTRVHRHQVRRNLVAVGEEMGLDFQLYPHLLKKFFTAVMARDKRSWIEKFLDCCVK